MVGRTRVSDANIICNTPKQMLLIFSLAMTPAGGTERYKIRDKFAVENSKYGKEISLRNSN